MVRSLFMLVAIGFLFTFGACEKEKEPFEYPDTEITEPTTVSHMTRRILHTEGWEASVSASGCEGNLPAEEYARLDTNFTRQYASMHLVPDDSNCALSIQASSPILSDEVASDYWTNWKFEFTFSQLRLSKTAKLRIHLEYREAKLDVDLAPFLRETIAPDTASTDTNGVFSMSLSPGYVEFALNGNLWKPDFSAGSGNSFSSTADVSEPFVDIHFSCDNTDAQSLLNFNFLRISSYGVPES